MTAEALSGAEAQLLDPQLEADLLAIDPAEAGVAIAEVVRVLGRPSLGGAGALFVLGAGLIHVLRRDGRADAEAGAVLALVARFTPRRGLQ